FGYFAAIIMLSGVVFGIAPALQASRLDLSEALKEGARSAGGPRGGLATSALVVFQVTLAGALAGGAGLWMRRFLLAADDISYPRGEQVLTAPLTLPASRYPKPEERQRFFEKLMPRLASLPGAQAVAFVSNPPGSGAAGWRFELEGQAIAEAERRPA